MRKSTSILHVTDTHVFKDPSLHIPHSNAFPYQGLVATLDAASRFHRSKNSSPTTPTTSANPNNDAPSSFIPDIILLTGDFTQDDTEEAFDLVATTIRNKFPKYDEKNTKNRIFSVEGNHSDIESYEKIFLDKHKFEGPRRARNDNNKSEQSSNVMIKNITPTWDLILVATHVPGQIYGDISEADLAIIQNYLIQNSSRSSKNENASDADTQQSRRRRRRAMLVMHHPPFSPPPWTQYNLWSDFCFPDSTRRKLKDLLWGELNTREEIIQIVLHGHCHMDWVFEVPKRKIGEQDKETAEENSAASSSSLAYIPPYVGVDDEKDNNESNRRRKIRLPIQVGTPATCHQYSTNLDVDPKPKHGCRILELFEENEEGNNNDDDNNSTLLFSYDCVIYCDQVFEFKDVKKEE